MTTLSCMQLGYVEQNPLYHLLGGNGFWALFILLSLVLLGFPIIAERKYWWAPLLIIIPIITHAICTIHNCRLMW